MYAAPPEAFFFIYLAFGLLKRARLEGQDWCQPPFRGALTLCDLEIIPQLLFPASPPVKGNDAGLPHGMLCGWTHWHQQSPGTRCHRGRIVGAAGLGIHNPGDLVSELMQTFQRGESRRMESVTGLCRHRSTFPVLEGGGGNWAVESAPLIFLFFSPSGLIQRLPM